MSLNSQKKQSLAAREEALLQRLFGSDWPRAAERIRQLASAKLRSHRPREKSFGPAGGEPGVKY